MKSAKIFFIFTLLLAFTLQVSAQSVQFPNELKSYRFFSKGKLKTIKLGFSTKSDLDKIFGITNDSFYEYDSNWTMSFSLIEVDSCVISETNDEKKQIFCPDKKFVGKLYSIELKPKQLISFAKISFANFSGRGVGSSIAEDGQSRGTLISFKSFRDNYGLSYQIFDGVASSTETNPTNMKKGDLISIEYGLSEKLNKKIFIKQK